MATPGQPPRGLSPAELAAACDELQALRSATVVDVASAPRAAADTDLVLVLSPGLQARKVLLHIVHCGPTARICPTTRRCPARPRATSARWRLRMGRIRAILPAKSVEFGEFSVDWPIRGGRGKAEGGNGTAS